MLKRRYIIAADGTELFVILSRRHSSSFVKIWSSFTSSTHHLSHMYITDYSEIRKLHTCETGNDEMFIFFLQSFLNNFIFTVVSNSRLFPYVRWPDGAKGWNFCWVISVKTTTFHFTWCWIRANEEIERKAESLEKTSKIDLKLTLEFYISLSSARDTTSESNFFNLQTHNEYSGRNEKFISRGERGERNECEKSTKLSFSLFLNGLWAH